jgi:hypothetical protein
VKPWPPGSHGIAILWLGVVGRRDFAGRRRLVERVEQIAGPIGAPHAVFLDPRQEVRRMSLTPPDNDWRDEEDNSPHLCWPPHARSHAISNKTSRHLCASWRSAMYRPVETSSGPGDSVFPVDGNPSRSESDGAGRPRVRIEAATSAIAAIARTSAVTADRARSRGFRARNRPRIASALMTSCVRMSVLQSRVHATIASIQS